LAFAALAAAAVTVGLGACESKITNNAAGRLCPGPDAFSEDARWILGSPQDTAGPVRLYDQTGKVATATLAAKGFGGDLSADGGAAVYFDLNANRGRIWRRSTNRSMDLRGLQTGTVSVPVGLSTDGVRVLSVAVTSVDAASGIAYLWNTSTDQTLAVIGGAPVTQALLSGNGRYVVVADTAHHIRRWDRWTSTAVTIATASNNNASPIESISDDGRYVLYDAAAADANGAPRLWDGTANKIVAAPVGTLGRNFLSLDLDATGSVIVMATFTDAGDYTVRRIVRSTGAWSTVFTGVDGGVALSNGAGDRIAYCHSSGSDGNPNLDLYVWLGGN
jgi:hypothetical protein